MTASSGKTSSGMTSSRVAFARHPVALAGVVITTVSGALFVALATAMAVGLLVNPYAGLLVFVALPAAFLAGLILIPIGVRLGRRWERLHPEAPVWPVLDFSLPRTRHVALAVLVLTGVNLVIMLLAGYGTMQWMESPSFCGQVCHEPMHPQFTAWQNAPHSNVTCVQCHIGKGGPAFVHYKMAGVRQLVHMVSNNYPRPIPGVADMRPAIETCGTCHWSGRSLGSILHVSHQYGDDEANSETVTAMTLHIGGPGAPTSSGRAIHWHADPDVRVEYVSTDAGRQTIPWVRVTRADGSVKEYAVEGVTTDTITGGVRRVMDCLDCHNVVAHRIASSPEQAVDVAMAAGQIPRSLPYVRREGVRLVRATYPSTDAALAAIETGLRGFYAGQAAQIDGQTLGRAVNGLQSVYRRNVFPTMNVSFGVYPDNIGHASSPGCLRCHDDSHTAKDGSTISGDCQTCHTMLDNLP